MPDEPTGLPPLTIDLVDVDDGSELLRSVIALGNGPAKRWLGPMPDAGFAERARKGTLLAATRDGALAGYVLYDLPSDRVQIGQLCVAEPARKLGVGRLLIAEVSRRHADRRGLELACRRDYPANDLWPKYGFRPANERAGRSRRRHPLTVWLLDHGHPDLFSVAAPERELAALDHNVFLDLVEPPESRPQGAESQELTADWLTQHVELGV